MSGIKNAEISKILKGWIAKSKYSQAKIAGELGVSPSIFSRQLSGRESFPFERIKKLAEMLAPPREEVVRLNAILTAAHEEKTPAIKRHYMDMINTTVDEIGPDGLLSQVLFEWLHYSKGQKIALITQASKIAESPEEYKISNGSEDKETGK